MSLRARLMAIMAALTLLPMLEMLRVLGKVDDSLFLGSFAMTLLAILGSTATIVRIDQIVAFFQGRDLRSRERLQSFYESVHEGVLTLDAEGRILDINTAMAQILGGDAQGLRGKVLWDLLRDGQAARRQLADPAASGKARSLEVEALRPDGTGLPLHLDLHPLSGAQGELFHQGFARVVEARLSEMTHRGELLRGLHTQVREALESLRSAAPEGPAIASELARLRAELEARMDPASLEAESIQVRREPFSAELLLEQLAGLFAPAAKRRGIQLAFDTEGLSLTLIGDAHYLFVAWKNLLENALQFSAGGDSVRVGLQVLPEDVVFSVADTGQGVSQADLPFLFKPFFRVRGAAKAPGMGLGLWIARKVAQAHGGEAWASSEPGKGSTFYMRILRKAPAPNLSPQAWRTS